MRLEKPDMDICSTFVESTTDYKYHNDYNGAEEMSRMSVKQETYHSKIQYHRKE